MSLATRARRRDGGGATPPATKRVAVYTRKSTDEGLDAEFNSLDAQRQAVEAYVLSQRGEGWAALPERYDDGGFTGANTDRPAFQRLLADVLAGKIDIVASYKLDRLSRSLADFIGAIKLFEKHGVAFVSVTQGFNTTTSTGRLLMNLLATFGEFEREQISERTRDKMRASRRRGLFVGGRPVLGYDVKEKRLVVNAVEAETVREIYRLYGEQASLVATIEEMNRRGITTKRLISAEGRVHPGRAFDKGALSRLLRNPVYIGKVAFDGERFAGNHEAILDEATWSATQGLLRSHDRGSVREDRNRWGALLTGVAFCARCGGVMGHVATQSGKRAYRYYVCQKVQKLGAKACPSSRVPAGALEAAVVERIRGIGREPQILRATTDSTHDEDGAQHSELESRMRILTQATARLVGERGRLLAAIGQGGGGVPSLVERLAVVDREIDVASADERVAREELVRMESGGGDDDEVARVLADFDSVWGELFPTERARIVRLVVERASYDGATGQVAIEFRRNGLRKVEGPAERRQA